MAMASSEPQLSEQKTQDGDEASSDQSALRAFQTEIAKDLTRSPVQRGEKVYPKPIVEPLDRLPFSTRTVQSFDKSVNQFHDESSNPYKNKREDNKPMKQLSSPNPYRHKSKWIYETKQFAADSNYDNNNSVHYFFGNRPQDSQQLSQNQEMLNEQLKNLQLNQNQIYQQQMQFNAAQQQQQQRQNYERMMQLQNNFLQFQSQLQNPGAFVDSANIPQNMFASNFQVNNPNFANQTPTNYPFNNNALPSFAIQSQQPINGIIDLTRSNDNCNQMQFPSNFVANAQSPQQAFIASQQRSAFMTNQGCMNNDQIQFHNQAQPLYNQQMQMPFPINTNFNAPPPAFYMQHMNPNNLDFINDPMRNINREFGNAIPIRF